MTQQTPGWSSREESGAYVPDCFVAALNPQMVSGTAQAHPGILQVAPLLVSRVWRG